MTLQEWLNNLPNSPTASQAADKAKVSKATFLRHQKKGMTTAEYAIAIARAFDVNEVLALRDLGFITDKAVRNASSVIDLHKVTNQQLLDEVLRRSDPEAVRLFGDPTGEAIDYEPIDELAQRRESKSAPRDMPLDAIADSSDYHEEENNEFDD